MATASAVLPRTRSVRPRPKVLVAALCLVSAALYAWMRAGVAADLHAPFAGWCRDVLEPGDWQCRLSVSDFLWTYAGGSLLVWLGLAVPGAVLAATGRRVSALVPALVAGAGALAISVIAVPGGSTQPFGISETFFGGAHGDAFWGLHAEAAILLDLVLVSAPALAVALIVRPPRRPRVTDLPRHAVWASTLAVGGAIAALRIAWPNLPHEQFLSAPFDDVAVSMVVMVLFGSMLGTDRRWWPWALVPAAVLLSLGPATAVMSIPSNLTAFTWFAVALPLAVVGLVASFWHPLATRLAGRRVASSPSAGVTSRMWSRSAVVLNTAAAGLLIACVMAARFDPLGIQVSTSLPTYLGARQLAEDVRTKTNLTEAIAAMEAYRAARGTYRGFDAAAGETLAPELAWSDAPTGVELVVQVAETSATIGRVMARSGSGRAFCAETSSVAGVTYGEARRVALARAVCDSEPLDGAALRMIDVRTLCDGADDGAILLFRSVQRNIREILATPVAA
jgi:hypothetical protein